MLSIEEHALVITSSGLWTHHHKTPSPRYLQNSEDVNDVTYGI